MITISIYITLYHISAVVNNAHRSVVTGAFITGLAGDIAFEEYGFGLLATDVIDNIPKAIKDKR